MRKIFMYSGEDGKAQITEFIKDANPKIKKKYEFMLRLIADENNQLKEPYIKHFFNRKI